MHMPKDMELWAEAHDGFEQDRIALVVIGTVRGIQDAVWRAMGDENVSAIGNLRVEPTPILR